MSRVSPDRLGQAAPGVPAAEPGRRSVRPPHRPLLGRLLGALESRLSGRALLPVKLTVDLALIALAALWTCLVVFGAKISAPNVTVFVLVVLAVRVPLYFLLSLWRNSWKHLSTLDLRQLATSALAAIPAYVAVLYGPSWLGFGPLLIGITRPSVVLLTEPAFYVLFLSGVRLLVRMYYRQAQGRSERLPVLIVGAGAAGVALGYLLEEGGGDYTVAGYVDDDPRKHGRVIRSRPVLGRIQDAPVVARQAGAELIAIAIPTLRPERLREILGELESCKLPVRIVPSLPELMSSRAPLDQLRELSLEDLLPREPIKLDRSALHAHLRDKTVLVTGGGGSIGRQLCRQVMEAGASRLLVLGRGENSVFEAVQELNEANGSCEIIPVICCIRDRRSLAKVFVDYRPEVVFHAAAHKHVPLMEMYPAEAIRNNVLGTLNVVQLSAEHQVGRLVLVSTDKAVRPANVMGASKRVAELIVSSYAQATGLPMVSVRFGNVLGSRGSVVPTMARQIQRRLPVTVTDPDMVRYFMTISEAVQLILQAAARGEPGETYVLKMGHPVRIYDLAQDLIRMAGLTPGGDITIQVIGRRPGEKLTEELFGHLEQEYLQTNEHFSVVPSRFLELPTLLAAVERLREAADREDGGNIIRLLQELLPDYHPVDLTPQALGPPEAAPPAASGGHDQ